MKRFILLFMIVALLLSGCGFSGTDIPREEIVAAYEAAGYSVWTDTYDEQLEQGQIASVQANHPDGGYIYFSFFESNEQAKACKKQYYHPLAMSFFAVIYGELYWPRWEVYGPVLVEYNLFDSEFLDPFHELVKFK